MPERKHPRPTEVQLIFLQGVRHACHLRWLSELNNFGFLWISALFLGKGYVPIFDYTAQWEQESILGQVRQERLVKSKR